MIFSIYNDSCITTIPNRRSDCYNASPILLHTCCYFKGIQAYSKVEKCTNVLKSKIEGETNGIPNVDIYINKTNERNLFGEHIYYLDCKSSFYKIGVFSFIMSLLFIFV